MIDFSKGSDVTGSATVPLRLETASKWDWKLVQAATKQTVRTIATLSKPALRTRMPHWPDYLPKFWTAFDPIDRPKYYAAAPLPVDRADQVMSWLLGIEMEADRIIVFARMFGITWRKIQLMDGRTEPTLRKRYRETLQSIATKLNHDGIEVFAASEN